MSKTEKRKSDHIRISMKDDILYKKSSGFHNYDFVHYAASELEEIDIDISTDFFGKIIPFPFMISCMTGGNEETGNINAQLAEIANQLKIPIGVGSQRAMLESDEHVDSFALVREKAGDVPVLGNIGAAEFVKFDSPDPINKMIDAIEADAFVIHLNLLQEMVQPEGTATFKGLIVKLAKFSREIHVPLIAKEVGFGIGKDAAETLLEAGVKGIDIAGAGGTSWSKIEYERSGSSSNEVFSEWGLPSSYCIRTVARLKRDYQFLLIGSGGIIDAESFAKSLALGADISAAARAILVTLMNDGQEAVIDLLNEWKSTLKKIMVLTNSKNLSEFKGKAKRKKELI